LKALASDRSAGTSVEFDGDSVRVERLEEGSFEGVDVALFSAGGSVSEQFAPAAVRAGAVVIDNTSAFRMRPEVPLVVPEVNADALEGEVVRDTLNVLLKFEQDIVAVEPQIAELIRQAGA
jgi:aspartate-semialdehyde dehydrogenase